MFMPKDDKHKKIIFITNKLKVLPRLVGINESSCNTSKQTETLIQTNERMCYI